MTGTTGTTRIAGDWIDRDDTQAVCAMLEAGGHRALCARLDAQGLGLMDAGAQFRAPVVENTVLRLEMRVDSWTTRSLRLAYAGFQEDRLCVQGHELRGVFVRRDGRMAAGNTAELRAALGFAED